MSHWCVHKWNRWNCQLILNSADFWQLFLFVYVKFISDLASNLNLAKFLFSIDLPLYSIFKAIFFCHKDYFIFQFKVFLNTFHNIKFSSQSFDVSEMLNNISLTNLCLYISIGMKTQTGWFFVFLSEVYRLSANNLLRYKLNIFSHLESVDQLSFNRFNSLYSSSCVHT